MPKQNIEISFMTGSSSNEFRILHVWKTDDALIVSSKLHNPSPFDMCDFGPVSASVSVEVDHELPVKHYAMGVESVYPPSFLGDYAPIHIQSETDIPEGERKNCLFENEYSESCERVNAAMFSAADSSHYPAYLYKFKLSENSYVGDMMNDAEVIKRLLGQEIHSDDEKIILFGLCVRYSCIIEYENKHTINKDEADQALSHFHLNREMGEKLVTLRDTYQPSFEEERKRREDAALLEERKAKDAAQTKSAPVNSFGLTQAGIGLFAGTVAALSLAALIECAKKSGPSL